MGKEWTESETLKAETLTRLRGTSARQEGEREHATTDYRKAEILEAVPGRHPWDTPSRVTADEFHTDFTDSHGCDSGCPRLRLR
jgi:hypothetical protein